MLRPTARFGATIFVLAPMLWLFGGCGERVTVADTREPESPGLVDPDGGISMLPDVQRLVSYCPSDRCPAGLTTCPGSHFPCDVDLRSDRGNCGACGFACPAPTLRETYECIEGRCVVTCNIDNHTLNCDGVSDNGCEADAIHDDHCAACGIKCTDPGKPCLNRTRFGDIGCGCLDGDLFCPGSFDPCIDAKFNDNNCGACDNACDPGGGGAERYPNTYYGCSASQCGALKCTRHWGDCDSDMVKNGCEISLFSRDHCGACGNACPADQDCLPDVYGEPKCMCPGNETYCAGECVDLATNRFNCGSCGYACREGVSLYSSGICTFGTCSLRCVQGRADCNGNMEDDCETDTNSDPQNCGVCGKVCDAIAGQACVGGQCVVEPCAEDGGVIPR
ncbi:hypothetical protein AKJ09_07356 [Labilithrix luteola]|uniref:Tryptophan synthase alpha chain n=1 Tax=Labilithrix luteola TaxID=1391654 RepID=A0A0K1Q4N3_9BACT|nr:hypothetical protein [Labilithrix luteola]AKV00693.1 hypothetical protein AKJ09_07356 [Labilithrix luteola]